MMRVFTIADERVGASVFGESGCHWFLCVHMVCENVLIRQLLAAIVAKYKLANFLVNAMEEASFQIVKWVFTL